MKISKCPKCEKTISEIKALPVKAKDGDKEMKGAVYVCPLCQTILGAGLDPLSTINEIANRVSLALKKTRHF